MRWRITVKKKRLRSDEDVSKGSDEDVSIGRDEDVCIGRDASDTFEVAPQWPDPGLSGPWATEAWVRGRRSSSDVADDED